MLHQHTHLHWVNREARCVTCGEKYGDRYFSELKGFFSPSDYDRYVKENPPKQINVIASTATEVRYDTKYL